MKKIISLFIIMTVMMFTSCTTNSDNVWLNSDTIFDFSGNSDDEFEEFIDTFNLISSDFIIETYNDYVNVYGKLPLIEFEILDEEKWNQHNEKYITIVKLRCISGSVEFVDVEYYYNKIDNKIVCKYVNNFKYDNYPDVEIGYAIDIITIPREIYFSIENQ